MLGDEFACGLSDADLIGGTIAASAYLAYRPVRHFLERRYLVKRHGPVDADIRAVAFLRSLDLDPVVVLGCEKVETADFESLLHTDN